MTKDNPYQNSVAFARPQAARDAAKAASVFDTRPVLRVCADGSKVRLGANRHQGLRRAACQQVGAIHSAVTDIEATVAAHGLSDDPKHASKVTGLTPAEAEGLELLQSIVRAPDAAAEHQARQRCGGRSLGVIGRGTSNR